MTQSSAKAVDNLRRSFLKNTGGLVLSAAAVSVMGNVRVASASGKAAEADITILNGAISAEREAVAAYALGIASGLLSKSVSALATDFKGHHEQHAEALISAVKTLGGAEVTEPESYNFPADQLKSEADVLKFAAGLEKGAVSAYLGAVPILGDRELAQVAASILGDEAMHWATLRGALGMHPVPVAFMS